MTFSAHAPRPRPSDETIRAFIAVEIPDDVRQEIGRTTAGFRRKDYPVRWVNPENLHLTLVFLGYNPAEFIAQVEYQLSKVAARTGRFELALKGLGAFPNERSARVIWVGADEGKDQLCALARSVAEEMIAIGFIPEKRPFSPHLTIGRVKAPIADIRPILGTTFAGRSFPVSEIVLVRSHLNPAGPVYERLAAFPLITVLAQSARTPPCGS